MLLGVHFKETLQHGLQLMFLENNSFLFNFDVCLLNQKYLSAVEARKNASMFYKTCNSPTQTFSIFTEIMLRIYLTLYCIMLKNGQTYFKNLAVFTPQDFKSMFGHFSILCNKGFNKIAELHSNLEGLR